MERYHQQLVESAMTPDDEQPVPHRSRKDTRTWCKGKVGVPHDYHVDEVFEYGLIRKILWRQKCSQCGKTRWRPHKEREAR